MAAEKLTTPTTTDNSLSPSIKWNRIFIVYELDTWLQDLNSEFILKECLFGGVKLAKKADPEKHVYSGYVIRFDSRSGR